MSTASAAAPIVCVDPSALAALLLDQPESDALATRLGEATRTTGPDVITPRHTDTI